MATVKKAKGSRRQRAEKKRVPPAGANKRTPVADAQAAPPQKLSSAWQLFIASGKFIATRWQFWLTFMVLYGFFSLLLVHNFSTDVAELKSSIAAFLGANTAATGLGTYAFLIASNTSSTGGAAAVYQYILLIIASLATIWALRQFMSEKAPPRLRVRDSLYEGMYPLVPFTIVLVVLSLSLVPMIAAGSLYSIVVSGGIAQTLPEQLIFLALLLVGFIITIWLLTRWLFALYIVTLIGARPAQALQDARRIVKGRQVVVIRKILFMLLLLVVASVIVMLPVILFVTAVSQMVLFALSLLAVPFIHTYLYSLYRELLA